MTDFNGLKALAQDSFPVGSAPTSPDVSRDLAARISAAVVEHVPIATVEIPDDGDGLLLPDLGGREFNALVAGVKRNGIMEPVIFDEQGVVLDGRQRLRAAKAAGETSFPRTVYVGLTEAQKVEVRLGCNLLRRHLDPAQQKKVAAQLRLSGMSLRLVAEATGLSKSTVSRAAADAAGVPGGTPAVELPAFVTGTDGKQYPTKPPTKVMAHTDKEQERVVAAAQAAGPSRRSGFTDLKAFERAGRDAQALKRRQAREAVEYSLPSDVEIRHQSLEDLREDLEPGSVDFVLTDPPYLAENMRDGTWTRAGEFAFHVLKPGGFAAFYAPTEFLPEFLTQIGQHGLTYWWQTVVTFAGQDVTRPERHVTSKYRPIVIFRKPPLDEAPAPHLVDLIVGTGRQKDTDHEWQQSTDDALRLVRTFAEAGDLVVDPFLGSGTFALAAMEAGCRFIGSETDHDHVQTARERMANRAASDDTLASEPPVIE